VQQTFCRPVGPPCSPGRQLAWTGGLAVLLLGLSSTARAAVEDIEFVSEHLVEVAMDHRYAALPVWPREASSRWSFTAQAGYSATRAGELELIGPTLSLAAHRALSRGWTVGGFAFADDLSFSGSNDRRPLDVSFAANVPLSLPAEAVFTDLQGSSRDSGLGLDVSHFIGSGPLSGWRWTAGVLWQSLELAGYSTPYVVLAGPSAGASGTIDYSVHYSYTTPFAGISRTFALGRWTIEPRFLVAAALPRRGVQGRISGDGFDLSGNSADFGHTRNYGDPSPVLGMVVRYEPWGLEVDLGAALSEAVIEPLMHPGVDQNIAISVAWQFDGRRRQF
jgi:hypothetical protein